MPSGFSDWRTRGLKRSTFTSNVSSEYNKFPIPSTHTSLHRQYIWGWQTLSCIPDISDMLTYLVLHYSKKLGLYYCPTDGISRISLALSNNLLMSRRPLMCLYSICIIWLRMQLWLSLVSSLVINNEVLQHGLEHIEFCRDTHTSQHTNNIISANNCHMALEKTQMTRD